MKWTRAVHHLETLARTCADMATRPASIFPLPVKQLWAAGDILGRPGEIEAVTVALTLDLPAAEVPWLSEPTGTQHWAMAARLAKIPVVPFWRSLHAPIWNHRIERPVLVWDTDGGVAEDILAALRDGLADSARPPAPTAAELRARLDDELGLSLPALREHSRGYADKRWKPGKLEPVADALWRAGEGYLDLLDAIGS